MSHSPAFARLSQGLSNNNFFRGMPALFAIAVIWFAGDPAKKLKIAAGLLAASLATTASVMTQGLRLFHVRPMLDPSLTLWFPADLDPRTWADSAPSWPSDTSTLYAALAMIVLMENRVAGAAVFLWTVIVILLPRIAFGYHYASDVISGVVLGSLSVGLVGMLRLGISPRIADLIDRRQALFNGLFVLGLWQVGDLMMDSREVIRAVRLFLHP